MKSELHIIFTGDEVLVSRKAYASWREIQDEYGDYKTSLGPWDETTTASWLNEEYVDLVPPANEQVAALLSSDQIVRALTFRTK